MAPLKAKRHFVRQSSVLISISFAPSVFSSTVHFCHFGVFPRPSYGFSRTLKTILSLIFCLALSLCQTMTGKPDFSTSASLVDISEHPNVVHVVTMCCHIYSLISIQKHKCSLRWPILSETSEDVFSEFKLSMQRFCVWETDSGAQFNQTTACCWLWKVTSSWTDTCEGICGKGRFLSTEPVSAVQNFGLNKNLLPEISVSLKILAKYSLNLRIELQSVDRTACLRGKGLDTSASRIWWSSLREEPADFNWSSQVIVGWGAVALDTHTQKLNP